MERQAARLDDMTNVTPITAAASYGQASAISQEKQTADVADQASEPSAPVINFEQTNNSPKALDEAEIYRQTNNQLAHLRKGLGLNPTLLSGFSRSR